MTVLSRLALSTAVGGGAYFAYNYTETGKVFRCKRALKRQQRYNASMELTHPELEERLYDQHERFIVVEGRSGGGLSSLFRRVAAKGKATASNPRPSVYINCQVSAFNKEEKVEDVLASIAKRLNYPLERGSLLKSEVPLYGLLRKLIWFLFPTPNVDDMVYVLEKAIAELTWEGHSPLILVDEIADLTRSDNPEVARAGQIFQQGLFYLAKRAVQDLYLTPAHPTFVFGTSGSMWFDRAFSDARINYFSVLKLPDATPEQLRAVAVAERKLRDHTFGTHLKSWIAAFRGTPEKESVTERELSIPEFKTLYDTFGTNVKLWVDALRVTPENESVENKAKFVANKLRSQYSSALSTVLNDKVYGARARQALQYLADSADGSVPFDDMRRRTGYSLEAMSLLCRHQLVYTDLFVVRFPSRIAADVVRDGLKHNASMRTAAAVVASPSAVVTANQDTAVPLM